MEFDFWELGLVPVEADSDTQPANANEQAAAKRMNAFIVGIRSKELWTRTVKLASPFVARLMASSNVPLGGSHLESDDKRHAPRKFLNRMEPAPTLRACQMGSWVTFGFVRGAFLRSRWG